MLIWNMAGLTRGEALKMIQTDCRRLTMGTPEDFAKFFSYLEPPGTEPIPITINQKARN